MTMMQKVQAKRSKKGFTLVELVIVIAILAILAAIAIPVITTTINSAKLSTMTSDSATLNMLVKEAVNTSKASITTTKWNEKDATTATIGDVCLENNIDDSENFYVREIGGKFYAIIYTGFGEQNGQVTVSAPLDTEPQARGSAADSNGTTGTVLGDEVAINELSAM